MARNGNRGLRVGVGSEDRQSNAREGGLAAEDLEELASGGCARKVEDDVESEDASPRSSLSGRGLNWFLPQRGRLGKPEKPMRKNWGI